MHCNICMKTIPQDEIMTIDLYRSPPQADDAFYNDICSDCFYKVRNFIRQIKDDLV